MGMPQGHVGPIVLAGTGRLVYWTGRVAIGLRHEPAPAAEPLTEPVRKPEGWLRVKAKPAPQHLGFAH